MNRALDNPVAQVFREWFAVKPAVAITLATLYAASGEVVRQATIIDATGQTMKGLRTSIRDLRVAMEPGSILNVNGVGYRLSDVGLADCGAALVDAQKRAA